MSRRNLFACIANQTDLLAESVPGQPIIEIAGNWRVLVENHAGILEYSPESLQVKTKQGTVRITGTDLRLAEISAVQVIVCGNIRGVALDRGEGV